MFVVSQEKVYCVCVAGLRSSRDQLNGGEVAKKKDHDPPIYFLIKFINIIIVNTIAAA